MAKCSQRSPIKEKEKLMLEGLKDVPWSNLSHAYGSASDVPENLRALTADDEDIRDRALSRLFATIYHQGTVYQASAYAVPFLLELLADRTVQRKESILSLLADLACGDGYIHQHLPLFQEKSALSLDVDEEIFDVQSQAQRNESSPVKRPEDQQQMEEELFWVRKTHQAIAEGVASYFPLLEHPDIQVKMNAAILLARLPEFANHTIPLLYRQFEEENDDRVKGNLIFALGMLDRDSQRGLQFISNLVVSAKSPLLQFVAALVLVESGREMIAPEAIDILIQVAINQFVIDEGAYEQIPGGFWRTPFAALNALQAITPQPAIYALRQLLSAFHSYLARFEEETGYNLQRYNSSKDFLLERQDGKSDAFTTDADNGMAALLANMDLNLQKFSYPVIGVVEEMCRTLVCLAFGKKRIKPGTCFRDLSLEQQRVLTTLLNCSLAWSSTGGYRDQATGQWRDTITCVANLNMVGFPSHFHGHQAREDLRAFIEQAERANG